MSKEYKPEVCDHCGQSTTYLLPIDLGTAEIMKVIGRFVGKKGINAVHPRKEMEGTLLTSNQVGNLSRPRMHGLIAKIEGNPGNYCITRKGGAFLRGVPVHKFVIRSKTEERTIGYWGDDMCTINDFKSFSGEYWEGIGYQILEGQIIFDHDENNHTGIEQKV